MNVTPPDPNPLKDVQNILGFLLAGFAGILGFIGLRSGEVTTVLRNDSAQASLIALILLLAALAAVIGVATPPGRANTPWLAMVAIFCLLFSLGPLVILQIPVVSSKSEHATTLAIFAGLLGIGIVALYILLCNRKDPWTKGSMPTQLVCIIASVILLATSAYGAMRLETDSQLNSSVQLSASIVQNTPGTDTLSLHVTAFKVTTVGYVGIIILGLPDGIPIIRDCKPRIVYRYNAGCSRDPCAYFYDKCKVIFGGTVPPDASGNINETLRDGIVTGKYQDISVQASVCHTLKGCRSAGSYVSRFDIHLSNLPSASAH
jgi:hypothetical protein